jgi:hypothetical protein
MVERFVNYAGSRFARLGATILYNSSEVELGTAASPLYTSPATSPNNQPVDLTGGKTILRAAISAASSGDNTVVAAVASKKIKVLEVVLIAAGDVDVRFESAAGGTALTGVMSLAADGNGFVAPMATPGLHHFETAAAALLNLELSAAVQVSGWLVYYTEA